LEAFDMAHEFIKVKDIIFDVVFEIDKDIESGDVIVEISYIGIDDVDVSEIIAQQWVNLIQNEIYVRSISSRSDRAAFFA
jgi:hypothetical protein